MVYGFGQSQDVALRHLSRSLHVSAVLFAVLVAYFLVVMPRTGPGPSAVVSFPIWLAVIVFLTGLSMAAVHGSGNGGPIICWILGTIPTLAFTLAYTFVLPGVTMVWAGGFTLIVGTIAGVVGFVGGAMFDWAQLRHKLTDEA